MRISDWSSDVCSSDLHTTSVEKIDIGLDASSKPVAWRHRSAATSFLSTFAPDEGVQHPVEIGMGLEDMPYDIPNVRAEQCRAYAHTRVGWSRSVSNIPRAFAIQRQEERRVGKECGGKVRTGCDP